MIWGDTKFLPQKEIDEIEFCLKNKLVTFILFFCLKYTRTSENLN